MKQLQIKTKKQYISLLVNSAHYFLQHVLIIRENKQYRLLVFHKKRKLMDKTFKTLKCARINFSRSFPTQTEIPKIPQWSPFYQPESEWLEKLLNMPIKRKEAIDAGNRKRDGGTQVHRKGIKKT
jgi:hypothetical protein